MTKTISFELPQQGASLGSEGETFDFKSLVNTVFKRFWLIAISAAAVFFTIAVMTFTQTPLYQANSVVIVDSNRSNVIDLGAVLSGGGLSTSVIDTEVRVISSKTLLRRVAIQNNLIEDPEFNPTLVESKPSLVGGLKDQIKGLFGVETEEFDPFEGMTPEEIEEELTNWAVGILRGKVGVSRIGTTYLISINVTSENPETAATLANAIADQYRVEQMEAKLAATRRATAWLSERTEGLREEVAEKENAVTRFREEKTIVVADGTSLREAEINGLQAQKLQLEQARSQARGRFDNMRRQLQSGAGIDTVTEVLDSDVIQNLKSQKAEINRRVAELEPTLGPLHPDLVAVKNEARDIDAQIDIEMRRILSSIEAEVNFAEDSIAQINRQISNARATVFRENADLVRLRELERDAQASRAIYEEFIERLKETREQDDLVEADARILSTASVPGAPSSPKTAMSLLIGLILGGIVGGMLAIIFEIFDTKLGSTDDIERKLGMPSIGSIPLIGGAGLLGFGRKDPSSFMLDNPLSGFTESIRYLRAAIAFSDIDRDTRTVAITSSLPDEGKTTLTLSLGRMSAMSGAKTLIVDGDFRRRQLTEAAEIKTDFGMVEYLLDPSGLDELIKTDERSGAHILPLSLNGHTPHDVFGTRAFDELHTKLRERYDLILIDTGPLLLMAEARVIAGKADKTILAVRWRKTTRATARKSINLLNTFRADVLGVVMNMIDIDRRRHHNEPGTAYRDYKKYYMTDNKVRFWKSKKNQKVSNTPIPNPAADTGPPPVAPKLATVSPAASAPVAAKRSNDEEGPEAPQPPLKKTAE